MPICGDVEIQEKPIVTKTTYVDVLETRWAYASVEAVTRPACSTVLLLPPRHITRSRLMTVLVRLNGTEAKTIEQGAA